MSLAAGRKGTALARSRFAPDRGLSFRMGLTMIVLALLYVVLIGAISYGTGAVWLGVLIGLGVLWGQWYFSDKLALSGMGAREVSPAEAPELHAMIDRLCALADMPKPRVAIADTDIPNAFAAGRSPDRAVVAVTTGVLRRLDERELEAVLSHELSHVAHRDVLVMTVASVVGVLAGFLTKMLLWSGLGNNRGGNNNAAIMVLIVTVVAAVVYGVSFVLTRLLSRYRELAADRAGAILTGQPSALASALTKISGDMGRIPKKDLRAAEPYNAFFFVPALTGKVDIASLFASHPPLEKRLEQLSRISVELGRE
nr:zinc metalloprotease HtpX [Jiangella ureilytica]